VFAQDIGPSKNPKARGMLVRQYVTKTPDKRFGNRGQAQFKGNATVVFTKEFMDKYKAPRQMVVKKTEAFSNASGRLSEQQKKLQARQRWKAGVFMEVKRRLGIAPDVNLTYELVEIIPTNAKEQVVYYTYEEQ